MAALIALAAVGLCAAGVSAGIIGMVSVAIRREEKNLTLTSGATDTVVRLGRWLNGVYVRVPRRTAGGRRTARAQRASRPGRDQDQQNAAAGPGGRVRALAGRRL